MPKRHDIKSILIIGAGPIVIGQACEFDYSGTQACQALRALGYRIILVNSNPATIMTDPGLADATYIEPIVPSVVEKIIAKERPDAILPTMGGQTALNCALSLNQLGVLERYNVELIGASAHSIDMAEDRELFRKAMSRIGLETPRASLAHNIQEALEALTMVGLPAIIRPSFTLGGTGGGIAYTKQEFIEIVEGGLDASPTSEVLVEESVLGWKEFEMEVVRDKADNCIIVCSIENIDPMGIHTGDSITVAPALTLTDKEYQRMRSASIAVLREIGVETGGSNVQFAVNPADGRLVVIEMNPRVSRSSALASKATGFPIAKIAAQLAVGFCLNELDNDITGGAMPASFEPTIDYIVTKIPRFAFEKFPGANATLTTSMKSVGEVMAIGRNFSESLQKALRGLETGLTGLDSALIPNLGQGDDHNAILAALAVPAANRLLIVAEAFRHGLTLNEINDACKIDPWFLGQIQQLVATEHSLKQQGIPNNSEEMRAIKRLGFSDARLALLTGKSESALRKHRRELDVHPQYKRIDSCAGEFKTPSAYMYSSYEAPFGGQLQCEAAPADTRKVVILGGGPNRIGQGIEFDYCCCHAAFALHEMGIESIMVNCNPETVSTDYDTSDRLYFEPLTAEDVIEIIRIEQQKGELLGVIIQFGGQTPLGLAQALLEEDIPILGTHPHMIDLAEDRKAFQTLLKKSGLRQPENAIATSLSEVRSKAHILGLPLVVRPSYVLGGRAMKIIRHFNELEEYIQQSLAELARGNTLGISIENINERIDAVLKKNPLLLDRYLDRAIEVDVDVLSDGDDVFICGVMEHIEEAGVHSGDSACVLPPNSVNAELVAEMSRQSTLLARELSVIGLMNVQFAIKNEQIFILEVNPRASRTVPFVAKAINQPIAKIAAKLMAGAKLTDFQLHPRQGAHIAVKEAVFPFERFPGVDVILGPEMRSTGEVMGIAKSFDHAFAKSQLAAGTAIPRSGTAFVSVCDEDKAPILPSIMRLKKCGFSIVATAGTQAFLERNGVAATKINKVLEGRPHIVDAIKNGKIEMVINTTEGLQALTDSKSLRRAALMHKVPYFTTLRSASAAVEVIEADLSGGLEVMALQDYFK